MDGRNNFARRLNFAVFFLALAVSAVGTKMYIMTAVKGEYYRQAGLQAQCTERTIPASRGAIVDRNGEVLATSVRSYNITRLTSYTYNSGSVRPLARALGMNAEDMDRKLQANPGRFQYLMRGAPQEVRDAVERLQIAGINDEPAGFRRYPLETTAANLIGILGKDRGLEGLEAGFNVQLTGRERTVSVCKDVDGEVFDAQQVDGESVIGHTVRLTIDTNLQEIVEQKLTAAVELADAEAGFVVAMDPRTGEILAMASRPTFDPGSYSQYSQAAFRNRPVFHLFEPGSTMKPFVVAAALEKGLITPDTVMFCENGKMMVEGRKTPVTDHHAYGDLSVTDVLRFSSNICSAKLGYQLGPENLHLFLSGFGFGDETGVPLPSEATGQGWDWERWRTGDIATVSFGQHASVTALQLAWAYSTLANGGVRLTPRIVRDVKTANGEYVEFYPTERQGYVVADTVARSVTEMLKGVVEPGGTAPEARVEGVAVAGKTGTAQKPKPSGGYYRDKYIASFAGFLPADDPRLVLVVVIDDPKGRRHYGGQVAGPVFRDIAEASVNYLGIPRQLPVRDEVETLEADAGTAPGEDPVADDAVADMGAEAVADGDTDAPIGRAVGGAFSGVMPNLSGLSLRAALRQLEGCDCNVGLDGSGYVKSQVPPSGAALAPSADVQLTLAHRL